jgi:predicted nucleic acid-binding protein
MDSYLAAFAESGGLTLVTFDRALAGRTPNSVLLA